MPTRTDRSHTVGLNASVHTQIIGVVQVCAWPIMVQYAVVYGAVSVVKKMTSAALRSWRMWLGIVHTIAYLIQVLGIQPTVNQFKGASKNHC